MRKKVVLLSCCFMLLLIFQAKGWGAVSSSGFSISGAVQQPIRLAAEDLAKFQSSTVRLNEVDRDEFYSGAFYYRGIPLRTILEMAHIQKEDASFSKFLDVCIVIRNAVGKQVVLSWGEVFYRNPAEFIIAFAAEPVLPELPQGREKWQNTLNRPIGFPKLIIASDLYTDRCMESIVSIDVMVLNPSMKIRNADDQYVPSFAVDGAVKTPLIISDLSGWPRESATIKVTGSLKGYHGVQHVSGVPLVKLLEKAGATMDLSTVYLVTHSDGYRAAVSFGELFLDPAGERILVADGNDNPNAAKEGRFTLHIPHDLSSDRNVKGIENIEVINLKKSPQVYIISVGCADSSLITLEALNYLNKADAVVCSEDIAKRYAFYIGHRPVLFDPFTLVPKSAEDNEHKKLSHPEREKLKTQRVDKAIALIREALNQGKSVALLEYGDPTIYGSFRGINAALADDEKQYLPGVSAFNAANALIGKEMACKGSIVLSSPWALKENPSLVKSAADQGDTLAVFMGLNEIESLIPLLKKYYPGTTPVTFAIRAGYSNSKRLIKTTLSEVLEAVRDENEEKESWLGMIYVGFCLK